MKTAIVYHFLPHYRAAVMRELLASPEHEYWLVADTRATDPGVKTWAMEDVSRFIFAPCKKLFASFLIQRGVLGIGIRSDLDAVVYLASPYFLSTWLSALLARATGKRVLFWTHGWTRSETGIKAALRNCFYRIAHGLLLYGHTAKADGMTKGFSSAKLHVIYNSLDYPFQSRQREQIDPASLSKLKEELFGDASLPMIICTARLTAACRFDLLLKAQSILKAAGHCVNVLLVGDGPERAAIEAMSRQLAVPVKFFGACYDESTLAKLTMAAHVTVSPGKVGLTAIQSLAYGTPVITHNDHRAQGPEWEAILPGRTGDFFKQGDASDLARVIMHWTKDLRPGAQLREECFQLLERFYNPAFQRRAIDRAVSGEPADDLFWLKEAV